MKHRAFFLLAPFLCLTIIVSGCGYSWRGQEGSIATQGVLGDGNSTIKIGHVEHTTVYPVIPYYTRSLFRDEITARHLGIWRDSGATDYTISVEVSSFQVHAYGQSRQQNLLYTASIVLDIIVTDGATGSQIWNSGLVSYSDRYSNVNEETVIRELLQSAIKRGVDRMQRIF